MLFRELTIRGKDGSLLWGYRTAAALHTWTIQREPEKPKGQPRLWLLSAHTAHIDTFQLRQRPLYFTAVRLGGGRWCWPVLELHIGERSISARLGAPEQ